jgi:hypothetical protein
MHGWLASEWVAGFGRNPRLISSEFAEVIERLRTENPAAYAKVIAGLLPKEIGGLDGQPLLSNIRVVYVRPGDAAPTPEAAGDVAAAALATALDSATDDHPDGGCVNWLAVIKEGITLS